MIGGRFNGALRGRSDLGRDLIVRKGKSMYIVQCKRWRAGREVRENAVFQLIGNRHNNQIGHQFNGVARGEVFPGLFVVFFII